MEGHSEGEWLEQTAQQAQRLFGFVKGGAGHLFKNIKDTSSKMMHTVQSVAGCVCVCVCMCVCVCVCVCTHACAYANTNAMCKMFSLVM